jgi:hypothetical protein
VGGAVHWIINQLLKNVYRLIVKDLLTLIFNSKSCYASQSVNQQNLGASIVINLFAGE